MNSFEEKLNNFELEAQRELDDMGDMSDGSFEYQRLIPERILTLIAIIKMQRQILDKYSSNDDVWEALQECEELLK